MSQAGKVDEKLVRKILNDIVDGIVDSANSIGAAHNITTGQARTVINSEEGQKEIADLRESFKMEFRMTAPPRLLNIIRHSEKPAEVIAASAALAKILGEEQPKHINKNYNQYNFFDKTIRELTAKGPKVLEDGKLDGSWPGGRAAISPATK